MLIKDLPLSIQALAEVNRAMQCNEEFLKKFDRDKALLRNDYWQGNFSWDKSPQGWKFWNQVNNGNFDVFYSDPSLRLYRKAELLQQCELLRSYAQTSVEKSHWDYVIIRINTYLFK